MDELSASQARRVALAAQGFTDPRPTGAVDRRHLRRVMARVAALQIDSVNVLVRSHHLPLFSRLGPYPMTLLDDAAYRRRELFEYWGHEASYLPVDLQPLLRWRMHRAETWGGMARVARERSDYVQAVYREVADRGPLAASELSSPGERRGPWWGWADGKRALEWLFWTGQLAAADRRNFARCYDLTERVIPARVLAAPTPTEAEAHRDLLVVAAAALGVGTARDLADYFRIRMPLARPRLAELVADGRLLAARVEGWREPAFLHPAARVPRRVRRRALLSPFDSLIWERSRTERLFGFRFRLEVYTPAPKRVHGYYVLPLLVDERLVARLDLKADRRRGRLLALAAFAEPGTDAHVVAEAAARELSSMAGWLGLEGVEVGERGDLALPLARALTSGTGGGDGNVQGT